jgi:hypothetical protein
MGTKYCYSIALVRPTQQHPGTLSRYGVLANDGSDSALYSGLMRLAWALTSGKADITDGDYVGFCYEQAARRSSLRLIV